MGRKGFAEEELSWRRRRVGVEFLRLVSVMLVRPWGESRVNDGMVGWLADGRERNRRFCVGFV